MLLRLTLVFSYLRSLSIVLLTAMFTLNEAYCPIGLSEAVSVQQCMSRVQLIFMKVTVARLKSYDALNEKFHPLVGWMLPDSVALWVMPRLNSRISLLKSL